MDNLNLRNQVDRTNELWIKGQYDLISSQGTQGYCLVSLALKNFMTYGHQIGEEQTEDAIIYCYNLLSDCLGEGEFIVRTYTWHFLLLLRCPPTLDALHEFAARLHFAIRDPLEARYGRKLFLEMGFFPMINPDISFAQARYFADFCRLSAYRQYPETSYDMYYVSLQDQGEEFMRLETMMQSALDTGCFKLYLQPKVDISTGMVAGAEALMRWIDPNEGMIPLSSFLPNMEMNGFIRDVDLYLFDQACGFMQRWQDDYGVQTTISFNLSKASFNGPYFMPEFTKVFSKYTIPPAAVRIELLESIVLNNLAHLAPLVDAIYDFGFSCALDDFGSGFSSFDVLINTRLSELKLDRALFQNINNPKERMIVRHIVDIAHDMGMITVAEGIETQEYADYLRQIGCDVIQGFLYYRPMPAEEFEQRFIIGNEGKGW